MGDKVRGKASGNGKKLKEVKSGNRPHEQREREAESIPQAPPNLRRVK